MDLSRDEIKKLVHERNLDTCEMHPPNDYYGNATVLKRFAGLPAKYSTRCVIEHGPFFPTLHWDVDLNSPLPVFLRANKAACRTIRPKTDKLVYAIGPTIAYTKCHLDNSSLSDIKSRIGKNLLIFPPHSTHHITKHYDHKWLMRHAHSIGKSYNSVTVCLYWKDFEDEPLYRAEGFNCITAGHMFDPLFLNRLKSFLTLADGVISYSWCSVIGYAVMMGIPTMTLPAHGERFIAPEAIITRDTTGGFHDKDNMRYRAKVFSLFSEMADVNEEKRRVIDYMWGLSDIKTKDQLNEIFRRAHEIFSKNKSLRNQPPADRQQASSKPSVAIKKDSFGRLVARRLTAQKLNLGCGDRFHPDWVNIDFKVNNPFVIQHDLSKGIPFEDDRFETVYHSHLLEHFSKNNTSSFLRECHRVLQKGGVLRVVVPDLEQIARLYLHLLEQSLKGDHKAQLRYDWIIKEMFNCSRRNQMPGENHIWIYDRYSLKKLLMETGFVEVKTCRPDESSISEFKRFHLDVLPDGSIRKPDSLYMEAFKV